MVNSYSLYSLCLSKFWNSDWKEDDEGGGGEGKRGRGEKRIGGDSGGERKERMSIAVGRFGCFVLFFPCP